MILLFNHLPVTLEQKIAKFIETVKATYGSDFYDVEGDRWFGDNLTVESLFPKWILKEAEDDPSNVLIVQVVKSYLRWLFSIPYGYGGYVPWENIRDPQTIPTKLLEGIADLYFPKADFSSTSDLNDLLPNIRTFALNADANYFNVKGSMVGIKYVLTSLIGLSVDACDVFTGSPGFIIVRANVPEQYKPFLNEYVYPAGMKILYESP